MSEPTIDEMLEWLDGAQQAWIHSTSAPEIKAIRAILEQHRNAAIIVDTDTFYAMDDAAGNIYIRTDNGLEPVVPRRPPPVWPNELEAIRAFVERVEKRIGESYGFGIKGECQAMQDELAAMEKQTE